MSNNIDDVLKKLREYVASHTASTGDYPVGICISGSGKYFTVNWALSSPSFHEELPGAVSEIERFLSEYQT